MDFNFFLFKPLTHSIALFADSQKERREKSHWLLYWWFIPVKKVKIVCFQGVTSAWPDFSKNSTLFPQCTCSCLRPYRKDMGLLGCSWQFGHLQELEITHFYFQRNPDQGSVLDNEDFSFMYCYLQSFWQHLDISYTWQHWWPSQQPET